MSSEIIEKIETQILDLPLKRVHKFSATTITTKSFLLVRIYTRNGLLGIGEATTPGGPWWAGEAIESIKVMEAGSPNEQRTVLAIELSVDNGEESIEKKNEMLSKAEIIVTGLIHPGVLIRFGTAVHHISNPAQSVRFYYDIEDHSVHMEVIGITVSA